MKIITVISSVSHPGFQLLRLSCALKDLELIALVANKYDLSSRREKDELLQAYLASEPDDNEIILFTDGYDAILLSGEKEILEKFRQTGRDLVFSTETACWPDTTLASQYPETTSGPYKFLNSGGFIGKVGIMKAFLNDGTEASDKYPESNQYLWTKRFLENPERIGLDISCQLFCTFSPEVGERYLPGPGSHNHYPYYEYMKEWFETSFSIQNGRIFNKISQTWPCQAHFNGHSKHLMDNDITDMLFTMIPNSKPVQFLYEMEG
jgi:hypothetical protein